MSRQGRAHRAEQAIAAAAEARASAEAAPEAAAHAPVAEPATAPAPGVADLELQVARYRVAAEHGLSVDVADSLAGTTVKELAASGALARARGDLAEEFGLGALGDRLRGESLVELRADAERLAASLPRPVDLDGGARAVSVAPRGTPEQEHGKFLLRLLGEDPRHGGGTF